MKLGKQTRREAKELFRATLVNGRMDEAKVRAVVTQVIEKKPRGYLAILEYFKKLVKLEQDRRSVQDESAIALSPEQQGGVASSLERLYGSGLSVQYSVNPDLIGGLRVRVGSDVYDGSVAARLENLEENFA
jgi:F-type H+-transporting ATPase subunit delta